MFIQWLCSKKFKIPLHKWELQKNGVWKDENEKIVVANKMFKELGKMPKEFQKLVQVGINKLETRLSKNRPKFGKVEKSRRPTEAGATFTLHVKRTYFFNAHRQFRGPTTPT